MITILYAGLLALLYTGLTVFVVMGRVKHRVGLGDGGVPDMAQRIRMHGNFAEFVPFCLLLVFLVDYSDYSPIIVHVLGFLLVLSRILHAMGIHASAGESAGRKYGTSLTLLIMVVCAILLIWKFLVLRVVGL